VDEKVALLNLNRNQLPSQGQTNSEFEDAISFTFSNVGVSTFFALILGIKVKSLKTTKKSYAKSPYTFYLHLSCFLLCRLLFSNFHTKKSDEI